MLNLIDGKVPHAFLSVLSGDKKELKEEESVNSEFM